MFWFVHFTSQTYLIIFNHVYLRLNLLICLYLLTYINPTLKPCMSYLSFVFRTLFCNILRQNIFILWLNLHLVNLAFLAKRLHYTRILILRHNLILWLLSRHGVCIDSPFFLLSLFLLLSVEVVELSLNDLVFVVGICISDLRDFSHVVVLLHAH